jgi:hypothetical protein
MAKTNYMNDSETKYDEARADKIKVLLKTLCATFGTIEIIIHV